MAYQNIIATKLGQQEATTSYVLLYKTPANARTIVKSFDICNTNSSNAKFYISLVPAGATAGTDNAIFYNTNIPGYSTVQWCGTQVLNPGDMIYIKASTTGCTISATGGEGT